MILRLDYHFQNYRKGMLIAKVFAAHPTTIVPQKPAPATPPFPAATGLDTKQGHVVLVFFWQQSPPFEQLQPDPFLAAEN